MKNIFFPASAYLEYELVLKSQGIDENEIIKDIIHFQNIENIRELPLDSSIIVTAIKLREKYNITYFDSLHCATALKNDGIIISSDKEFKKISNLEVIEPKNLIKN